MKILLSNPKCSDLKNLSSLSHDEIENLSVQYCIDDNHNAFSHVSITPDGDIIIIVPNEYQHGMYSFRYRVVDAINTFKMGNACDIFGDQLIMVPNNKDALTSELVQFLKMVSPQYRYFAYFEYGGESYIFAKLLHEHDSKPTFVQDVALLSHEQYHSIITCSDCSSFDSYFDSLSNRMVECFHYVQLFDSVEVAYLPLDEFNIRYGQVLYVQSYDGAITTINPFQTIEEQIIQYANTIMEEI